jgi:hypothetical protein
MMGILIGSDVVRVSHSERHSHLLERLRLSTRELLTDAASLLPERIHPARRESETKIVPKKGNPPAAASSNEPVDHNQKNKRYRAALDYLFNVSGYNRDDVELSFAHYLREDLSFSTEETHELVRMSFWKGFVTLQKEWEPNKTEALVTAFSWEKKLKQAGFAAKGLDLLSNDIEAAEQLVRNHSTASEDISTKESPL